METNPIFLCSPQITGLPAKNYSSFELGFEGEKTSLGDQWGTVFSESGLKLPLADYGAGFELAFRPAKRQKECAVSLTWNYPHRSSSAPLETCGINSR